MPGWYPDPSGQPGQFRYWNGSNWSHETSANPQAPPPGLAGSPLAAPRKKSGRGGVIGVLVLLLVLILAGVFIVRSFLDDDAPTANPAPTSTVTPWDDRSPTATPTPSTPTPSETEPTPDEPTEAPMIACPDGDPGSRAPYPSDGRVYGGGISFSPPADWEPGGFYAGGLSWAFDVDGVMTTVEPGWAAMMAAGQLRVADGFEAPEQAASGVMMCVESSGFYSNFASSEPVWSKAITVGGHKGWYLRNKVFIDDPTIQAPGDVVDVIVLDIGNPEGLSMFVGAVAIDDAALLKLLDQAVADLKVG